MDKLKDHWKEVAVGVAAVLVSYYAYRSLASEEKVPVGSARTPRVKGKDGKEWPVPRKIISEDMT